MRHQRSGKTITVRWLVGIGPSIVGGYARYGQPGVIATGRIMATVIPGSIQSNRDRAELVALRRLGTVEDSAKDIEFLVTDLSDNALVALIPIRWWVGSRLSRRTALSPGETSQVFGC
jgi:hypothetical protein